jgi:hypothetical protein
MERRNFRVAMGAVLLLGFATRVFAQAPGRPPGGPGRFGPPPGLGGADGGFLFEGLVGHFGGKPVTNAPFTAQVVSEHKQRLQDGTTVDNKTTGTITRDSSGRTRRQLTMSTIGPISSSGKASNLAFISDPVEQVNLVLDDENKIVLKLPMMRGPGGPPNGATGTPIPPNDGYSRIRPNEEVLGTKTLENENLLVQGTRIRHTIPPGAMGNASPLNIITERWYSPELQLVVSETTNDPRSGITTFELTNITRVEPDATLFTAPSDYTVKEGRGNGPRARAGRKQPPPTPPPA